MIIIYVLVYVFALLNFLDLFKISKTYCKMLALSLLKRSV